MIHLKKSMLVSATSAALMLMSTGIGVSASHRPAVHYNNVSYSVHRRVPKRAALARSLFSTYRKVGLNKKQSAALVGVAYKNSQMRPNVHQIGGGPGYGLYQVNNKRSLRNWCQHHRLNYRSVKGQGLYYYYHFAKPMHFNKTKGSLAHLTKFIEERCQRSGIPTNKIDVHYAHVFYQLFA